MKRTKSQEKSVANVAEIMQAVEKAEREFGERWILKVYQRELEKKDKNA
ncbi:hypothetical protein [Campylobacter troglodytis]|nr:hypothetical protein [Campylobacter troglodytis]